VGTLSALNMSVITLKFFIEQIWHSEDRASWYILTIRANKMHYF